MSKAELKRAIIAARNARNSASQSLKRLADIKAPKGAKKALGVLRDKLRSIRERMEERIPDLRKRLEAKRKGGAADAVKWAKSQIGKAETGTSNTGPYPVSECQEFTIGYDGVPWCGCFVAYAAIAKGGAKIPSKSRLAYTPYICADANANANGLRKVSPSDVRAGDFVVFDFDGGGADHVGIATGPFTSVTHCVEGNTSGSASGSQSNGGQVAYRERPLSQVACIARPAY